MWQRFFTLLLLLRKKHMAKNKKEERRKLSFSDGLRIVGLIFFLGVLFYPTISDLLSHFNSSYAVASYDQEVLGLDQTTKDQMMVAARQYNEALGNESPLYDPFSEALTSDEGYLQQLNASPDGMMGTLRIPKIHVELPIYHTTGEGVLQKGVGHMEGTSLPIGGVGTHAVLSGHRGIPKSVLFTDLDLLEIGDIFYVKVLDESLAYEVDQIKTVLPHETEDIQIVPGMDYVTLLTCTPYSVNTHRLLVRGHRVDYREATAVEPDEVHFTLYVPDEVKVLSLVLLLVLIFVLVIKKLRRHKKDEDHS